MGDEFEAKQKELEGVVNPIMMKVYQAAGGGGDMPEGGMPGGMGGGNAPGGGGAQQLRKSIERVETTPELALAVCGCGFSPAKADRLLEATCCPLLGVYTVARQRAEEHEFVHRPIQWYFKLNQCKR